MWYTAYLEHIRGTKQALDANSAILVIFMLGLKGSVPRVYVASNTATPKTIKNVSK